MSLRRIVAAMCAVAVVYAVVSAAQKSPPKVLIDKDICPGEGCSYKGRPRVLKATTAYADPNHNSSPVSEFVAEDVLTPSRSEVHTVAGRFIVRRAYGRYRPGDVLWVYTYLGEGVFKVWQRGRMDEENLEFSPWGGSAGKRCEKDGSCWGELEKELAMTWWLKVRSADGRQGWIHVNKNLEWEE